MVEHTTSFQHNANANRAASNRHSPIYAEVHNENYISQIDNRRHHELVLEEQVRDHRKLVLSRVDTAAQQFVVSTHGVDDCG